VVSGQWLVVSEKPLGLATGNTSLIRTSDAAGTLKWFH